jgi:hypothetical protein
VQPFDVLGEHTIQKALQLAGVGYSGRLRGG